MKTDLKRNGFTIVELLIVIVVIAILAAVTIVAYNGIQERAQNSTVQSEIRTLAQKLHTYYIDNGRYPSLSAELASLGWKASFPNYQQNSGGNVLYCAIASGANARFVVAARTPKNNAYTYSSSGGLATYTGSWTGAHATDCPIHGIPTAEVGYTQNQGYHPAGWGTPGWKVWLGGTV